jgi:outer membrane protein assembly factor BamB
MNKTQIAIFILLTALTQFSAGQWRGPDRDGHFPERGLLTTWPKDGPELMLKTSGIGEGFSSPVLHRGTIYVTGKKDTLDYLSSINLNGEINWQVPYGRSWIRSFGNSRSTPFLEDNRAYLLSGTGRLVCVDAGSGEEIWSADADKDFEADWHTWGLAESPLVVDDLVICSPTGQQTNMVAYNKFTGELVWQTVALGGQRSYVSPRLYEHGDSRLILGMSTHDVYAVDPASGEIAWSYPYHLQCEVEGRIRTIYTNTPLYRGREIFITSGYNNPAIMLELSADGKSVREKWRSNTLDNHHGHVVLVGDHLYGANWHDNRYGDWVCVDWETGEDMWTKKWYNKGSIITDGEMLYIYEEKSGNVALVKADPHKFEISGTFRVADGSGPHWAHPYINDGKLLLRHGDFLFVYNIRP